MSAPDGIVIPLGRGTSHASLGLCLNQPAVPDEGRLNLSSPYPSSRISGSNPAGPNGRVPSD